MGGAQPLAEAVRLSAKVSNMFTDAGFALNVAKSHLDPKAEQEFIGYLVNCSLYWGLGNIGYLAPSDKRLHCLVALTKKLYQRWYRVAPRELASVTGYVVSLRPMFDPAALMFTKYMYTWIQSLVDNGFSYDWHTHLSSEAQSELQVWITYAATWSKKALWRSAGTMSVVAQDASDTAVGDWLDLFGGCESVLVRKRNRMGEYRVSQHSVWFTEDIHVLANPSKQLHFY